MLMIKPIKQRDLDSNSSDITIQAIRHPFTSPSSFALRHDIEETCSVSIPVYVGGRTAANFMSAPTGPSI